MTAQRLAVGTAHPNRKRRHELKGQCIQCGVRPPRENRKTCRRCLAMAGRQQSERYRVLREAALAAYGRTCASAECTTPGAPLTIDHMDGQGAEHSALHKIRNTMQLLAWLRRNNWPDGFRNAHKGKHPAPGRVAPVLRQSTLFDRGAA